MFSFFLGLLPFMAVAQAPEAVVEPLNKHELVFCRVMSAFKEVQVMSGDFQQEKMLPVFSQPLVSSGHFLSVQGHGVVWEIQKPVASRMLMTPGVLKQYTAKGVRQLRTTGTSYDGLGVLLPAFFEGSHRLLTRYFLVDSKSQGGEWQVSFVPRPGKLAEMILSVTVRGVNSQLLSAHIIGVAGDNTKITFDHLKTSKKTASQKQLSWFL